MRTQTQTRHAETDIVAIMAAHGIALTGAGAELKGRCPFHEDKTPSLSVNRDKGVFHCFGCGAKGNAKVFTARMSGRLVTGRDLIEKRFEPAGSVSTQGQDVGAIITRVVGLYHDALGRNKAALDYLAGRGLGDPDLLRRFRVGFADSSLRKTAPPRSEAGRVLRQLGYVNERGGEFFAGRIVWPLTDAAGAVVGMYGRVLVERQGVVVHLYPRGPHRGIFNREGAKLAVTLGEPVIICECVIDALSCVAAGMPGAIALFGANGLTQEHVDLIAELRPARVVVMLDGDNAGRAGSERVVEKLAPLGLNIAVAKLPEGKDANEVLRESGPEALRAAVANAEASRGETIARPAEAEVPAAVAAGTLTITPGGELIFTSEARAYHVKNFNAFGFSRMRATLLLAGKTDGLVHIDTLDLYSNRARASFIADASARLELDASAIEGDLLNLVLALDEHRKNTAAKMQGRPRDTEHVMTSEERAAGIAFLTAPDLVAEIVRDCATVGYVGEADNKTLGYLIATSRKMREPLSAILVASSGAGKSALMDILEEMMPPEDLYAVSDLTDNALFYMQPDELTHKLVIIAERSGSEDADYSLRELQTKRILRKGVAIKDPESGRIKTVRIEVRGPVAVMESTTNPRMNPENANRCFVLHVDESRAQTIAIQEAQRRAKSAEGLEGDESRAAVIARHQAAQRLLEPLRVVIPFAQAIKFPAETVRTRRDHARFLNLIEAVAFLNQMKRAVKESRGVRYIEASFEDYDLARSLALEVLKANLDELPRASRALLEKMEAEAAKRNPQKRDATLFARRDLTGLTGWTYAQIRNAITPLLDSETVTMERGTRGMALYRLGSSIERPTVEIPTSAEIASKLS